MSGACTLWLDHIGPFDWRQCCAQHDHDYAVGVVKAIADAHLERCVDAVLPGMGIVMFVGVVLFGGFWYAAAQAKRQ